MTSSQFNVRTPDTLIKELDSLVDSGMFRNRIEAVNEGIRTFSGITILTRCAQKSISHHRRR